MSANMTPKKERWQNGMRRKKER